jgi:hypothetical protein
MSLLGQIRKIIHHNSFLLCTDPQGVLNTSEIIIIYHLFILNNLQPRSRVRVSNRSVAEDCRVAAASAPCSGAPSSCRCHHAGRPPSSGQHPAGPSPPVASIPCVCLYIAGQRRHV